MTPRSLVRLAILGEAALVLVAVAWQQWREIPLSYGEPTSGLLSGLVGAMGLAAINAYVMCGAPDVSAVRSIRKLYAVGLKPMFERLSLAHIVVISVAAGCGEEILFRGVLMPEVGLVTSSLVFGLLHTGGQGTLAFGLWVAVMGGALGWLTTWAGGLLAPTVAHVVYDALAMSYIRWGSDCEAVTRAVVPCPSDRA